MLFLAGALSSAWLTPPARFAHGGDARMAVAASPTLPVPTPPARFARGGDARMAVVPKVKLPVPKLPTNAKVPWALHKFGGASLATPELYRTVGDLIIEEAKPSGRSAGAVPTMAVVSAMGGMTDLLIKVVDSALVNFDDAKADLETAIDRQVTTLRELARGLEGDGLLVLERRLERAHLGGERRGDGRRVDGRRGLLRGLEGVVGRRLEGVIVIRVHRLFPQRGARRRCRRRSRVQG